ncbi:NAD(P)H-binding protein [Filimonas effusa]|uniref:NAD-dependent dehydratase n=1 Tax=Filimonas effusa TaxID=2508721 RepID=A0A4Q1D0K0_9BACT|nr:NAD(P)H-binding protein [Filimonas effusa]RXK81259.1 NAD-dependent dehydratase [Filimonas effusa]
MNITISGSLGNIGRPLTKQLVAAGHTVTVISSNSDRKADIEALGARAAIGSVSNASFLKQALNDAAAVFAMTPPNMGGSNIINNTVDAGRAFATAIAETGVKHVVMLSSIGADAPGGTGPITGLHRIEKLYSELENVSVTFLRAGYFFTNFYNDVPLIKGAGIMGANFPATTPLALAHPEDIATAAADALRQSPEGKTVRYIVSDMRQPAEVAAELGKAIGLPTLPWVEFTDAQALAGMTQAGVPEEIAGLYTEMGTGIRNGIILADFQQTGSPANGKTKLEDFAKEFARKY